MYKYTNNGVSMVTRPCLKTWNLINLIYSELPTSGKEKGLSPTTLRRRHPKTHVYLPKITCERDIIWSVHGLSLVKSILCRSACILVQQEFTDRGNSEESENGSKTLRESGPAVDTGNPVSPSQGER